MASTRFSARNARRQCTRTGIPAMERNCLGVDGPPGRPTEGPLPADILVPIPAAGRITNTRIESGVYKIVAHEASVRAGDRGSQDLKWFPSSLPQRKAHSVVF